MVIKYQSKLLPYTAFSVILRFLVLFFSDNYVSIICHQLSANTGFLQLDLCCAEASRDFLQQMLPTYIFVIRVPIQNVCVYGVLISNQFLFESFSKWFPLFCHDIHMPLNVTPASAVLYALPVSLITCSLISILILYSDTHLHITSGLVHQCSYKLLFSQSWAVVAFIFKGNWDHRSSGDKNTWIRNL
jgi:hypothetical protein